MTKEEEPAEIRTVDGMQRQTGDAVSLVPVSRLDASALHAMIRRNEDRLALFFPGLLHAGASLEKSRRYIDHHEEMERAGRSFMFGIPASDEGLAGLIFLNAIDPDARVAEAAGVVDFAHEGCGLMSGAMRLVFDIARDRLGLARIRFLIAPNNARSIALAGALGFRREPRKLRRFAAGTDRETRLHRYTLELCR